MSCPTEPQGAQGGAFPAPPQLPPPSEAWVPAQVLQRLEARRQQGPEAEAAAMERQMEEARENLRKAEVGPPVRELGVALEVCHPRVVAGMLHLGCGCCHTRGWGRWGWDSSRGVLGTVSMSGVPR